jgi:hypothetical protein
LDDTSDEETDICPTYSDEQIVESLKAVSHLTLRWKAQRLQHSGSQDYK